MNYLQGIVIMLLCISTSVYAQPDIELNGTTQYSLNITPKLSDRTFLSRANVPQHYIRLLNVKLSENAWKKIETNTTVSSSTTQSVSPQYQTLPRKVQLGMNNVPVLDQGPYGTCVTFAITAAIDAASNHGDYISQLCQLELGQYLENTTNGSMVSGWDGSMGQMVLSQMDSFGFVTKQLEKTVGCAGLTKYPTNGTVPQNELSLSDYQRLSRSMTEEGAMNVGWSSILDMYQAFIDDTDRDELLNKVKDSLNMGDRLTFGVLLFSPEFGVVGAIGQHVVPNDTWVLSPSINGKIDRHDLNGGHEMIIIGYDDDAVATDANGNQYTGLLTLRNSWGKYAGDAGNFYMSYDYFKRLAVEVFRIRQLDDK